MDTRIPRVAIAEPSFELARFLELAVRTAGYDPVRWRQGDELPDVDILLVEPSLVGEHRPESVPRDRERSLAIVYLAKPFRLAELRRALVEAAAAPGTTRRLLSSSEVR